jgi:hypothetical protein
MLKERYKVTEYEEEDVSNSWMSFRERQCTGI